MLAKRRGQLSRQIEHKGTGAFTPAHSFHSPAPTPFPVSIQPHSPWLRSQATSHRNAGHKHKRGASCGDTHHVNGGTQKWGIYQSSSFLKHYWLILAGDELTAVGCATMMFMGSLFRKKVDLQPNIWAHALSQRDLDIKTSRHGKISGYKALFTRKTSANSFLFLVHMHSVHSSGVVKQAGLLRSRGAVTSNHHKGNRLPLSCRGSHWFTITASEE